MGKGPPPTADGSVILQPDKGWFFGEGDFQFTQCLFLGHDWELLVQEILTFAVADIWFRNTTLSIFLVFLLHHFIRLVCEASARNIAVVHGRRAVPDLGVSPFGRFRRSLGKGRHKGNPR